jgi:hypothetical protein
MDRNLVIAEAIQAALKEKGWSIDTIEGPTAPRGFWHDVAKLLPHTLPFQSSPSDISNYLSKKGGQNRTKVFDIVRQLSADNAHYAHSDSESALPTESAHQQTLLTEDDVRRIVADELLKRKPEIDDIFHNGHTELAPEPPAVTGEGKGRRYQRKYLKVSITVDMELWLLFQKEQKSMHTTAPHLMDSILWNHFGRPLLSFEKHEDKK